MSDDRLESLVSALEVACGAPTSAGADGRTAVRVSCSMGPRPRAGVSLWPADASWRTVTVATLGNQTWDEHGGARVTSGAVAHPTAADDVRAVQVVGHTGCRVVEDAYDRHVGPDRDGPAGIEARLAPLTSLAADAVETGVIDQSAPPRIVRYRLVEYNVVRQVEFLRERLPGRVLVAGYVSDQDGAYGSVPGRQYLVTVDGTVDPDAIRSDHAGVESVPVGSLLQ